MSLYVCICHHLSTVSLLRAFVDFFVWEVSAVVLQNESQRVVWLPNMANRKPEMVRDML